ncbi:hypothetical protein RchiOBHm_Chr7g0217521 [Rosa chinensis]|uniref:Uncharacterized protein n=1 Tax=Rosa chinensis TaxID=74649 RepID=A0A2P6PC08_ROSCH|nr:hypothetical protein RchiOBHm_Chr7g0217521 [Rosa chinensis]
MNHPRRYCCIISLSVCFSITSKMMLHRPRQKVLHLTWCILLVSIEIEMCVQLFI